MSLIFSYFKDKMKVFGGFFRKIVRVSVIWSREIVFVSALRVLRSEFKF